ncbi:MAG: hypothetical protein ACTHLR_11465 [Rhizomicrobium sp.]
MSDSKSIAIVSTTTAWRRAPRVEKTRFSNALDGERHETAERDGELRAKALRTTLSHNETAASSRDWIQEPLVPGFVAQVLAQVMPGDARRAASAFAAYGDSAPQIARVYDRRL